MSEEAVIQLISPENNLVRIDSPHAEEPEATIHSLHEDTMEETNYDDSNQHEDKGESNTTISDTENAESSYISIFRSHISLCKPIAVNAGHATQRAEFEFGKGDVKFASRKTYQAKGKSSLHLHITSASFPLKKSNLVKLDPTSLLWKIPKLKNEGCKLNMNWEQLAVYAIANSPNRKLSLEEIADTLERNLHEELNWLSHSVFLSFMSGEVGYRTSLRDHIKVALQKHDFPAYLQRDEDGLWRFYLPPGSEWSVFPQNHEPSATYHWNLLPAEIRASIFEWIFQLPNTAPWRVHDYHLETAENNHRLARSDPSHRYGMWMYKMSSGMPTAVAPRIHLMREFFQPLLVSQQFYYEGYPKFFENTAFRLDSLKGLRMFLRGMGENRRSWLRQLSFEYNPPVCSHYAGDTFKMLRTLRLRRLHLSIDEDKLIQSVENNWNMVEDFPGFQELAKLQGSIQLTASKGAVPASKTLKYLRPVPKPISEAKQKPCSGTLRKKVICSGKIEKALPKAGSGRKTTRLRKTPTAVHTTDHTGRVTRSKSKKSRP